MASTFNSDSACSIHLSEAKVLFEPSVYGGDGTERRRGIVLEVSQEDVNYVRALEANLDERKLISAIKEGGRLRAKIDMDAVRVWNQDKSPGEMPLVLKDTHVSAAIQCNGTWSSKTQTGLVLAVTDLLIVPPTRQPCPF